uniref:GTP-binding protein Di-Ras2 n=1 Tax=Rhabditophanes sp. KR3021 TaxID=114890 RepID=A0AC35U8X4_9BILA
MSGNEVHHRLVVLGSSKVGKTSIIKRYLYNDFPDKYRETVEDMHSRIFNIHGTELCIDILDTNFNFPDMRKVAVASASAIMIVFGVDNVQSFKEMSDLFSEIQGIRQDSTKIPMIIVGNKGELESKKIFEATARAWTSRLSSKVNYIEVSAKTGSNVTQIFKTLLDLSGFAEEALASQEELQNAATAQKVQNSGGFIKRVGSLKKNNNHHEVNKNLERVKEASVSPLIALTTQLSTPTLGITGDMGMLKRNRSLRIMTGKEKYEKDEKSEEPKTMTRSGSLIRRTKHLSLKMRKSTDKNASPPAIDQSDCIIS